MSLSVQDGVQSQAARRGAALLGPNTVTRAQSTAHSPAEQSAYRPDIDGLRAVAVGLVILQHVGLVFKGGFVGVDVFFVISGFLITRIILTGCEAGTFSLKDFWVRRIRRILPAAAVTVVATLVAGFVLLPPRDLSLLAESAMAQQFVAANIYFWQHGGYFDLPAERTPLLHTWSLAVEEQFYIAYPTLLLVLSRASKRTQFQAVVLIAAGSLILSEVVTRSHPSAAFYWMPTRMWELLLGGMLAFCPTRWTRLLQRSAALGAIGFALILLSAAIYTPFTRFPGISALMPCVGAALLIAAPSKHWGSASKLLSKSALVYIGKASYSIYLWHWPLVVFARSEFGSRISTTTSLAIVVVSGILGVLSYHLVEVPFRSRRYLANDNRFVFFSLMTTVAICVACFAIERWVGIRYPEQVLQTNQASVTSDRAIVSPTSNSNQPSFAVSAADLHLPEQSQLLGGVNGVCYRAPSFVLWGDSHAQSLAALFNSLACSRGICGVSCIRAGFVPLEGAWCQVSSISGEEDQLKWNDDVVTWVKKHQIRDVFIVARWDSKIPAFDVGPEYQGLIRSRNSSKRSSAESRRVFNDTFRKTISTFDAAGSRVWFLRQLPVQDEKTFATLTGPEARGVSRQAYWQQQQELELLLEAISAPNLTLVGPSDLWFDADEYSLKSDGKSAYYFDDDHLNDTGARLLVSPMLEPIFDLMSKP